MINRRRGIRAVKRGLLAVFLVLTISSASQAGPIGVVIEPYPSILAGFITSTYNATTGAFAANGWALTLDTEGASQSLTTFPGFTLLATIDKTSGVATNGSLTIGSVGSPLLRSLNLVGFAFERVQGGALEFLFSAASTSGSYVPSVYSGLKPIDVMLTVGNTFTGTFASSWSSSSNSAQIREDAPAVDTPEPATLLLILAGAGVLYRQRRKRNVLV
jgi:PEP-CTERM motif-containing protein